MLLDRSMEAPLLDNLAGELFGMCVCTMSGVVRVPLVWLCDRSRRVAQTQRDASREKQSKREIRQQRSRRGRQGTVAFAATSTHEISVSCLIALLLLSLLSFCVVCFCAFAANVHNQTQKARTADQHNTNMCKSCHLSSLLSYVIIPDHRKSDCHPIAWFVLILRAFLKELQAGFVQILARAT